ncbi:hypothetical protein [Bradyrhizobium sp.]
MSENAVQSNPPEAEAEKTIVLLLPQALGDHVDQGLLRDTLGSSKDVRVLLCLMDSSGDALVHALKGAISDLKKSGRDVKVQVLLGPAIAEPDIQAEVVAKVQLSLSVDEKTSVNDHTEFALALSDVVLLAPAFVALTSAALPKDLPENLKKLLRTIEDLGKSKVKPGDRLPALASLAGIATGLDPERPGWFGASRCYFWVGRLEQFSLELFAFNWRGWKTARDSSKRLINCLDAEWRPKSYAPINWEKPVPDSGTKETSMILACFSGLDRSALYGSHKHRDFVWMEYLGAATAVLLAVAGHVTHGRWPWGVAELAVLMLVGSLVLYARGTRLQDRWTACRLGAEQMRIALMSLPLLVLPEALATKETPPPPQKKGHRDVGVTLDFAALQQVKRAVRQHGLPRLDPAFTPKQAVEWLQQIIRNQMKYHDNNHLRLERAERRLQIISILIFLLAIVGVLLHFRFEANSLLLLTAAAPAFAAALHETGTHLGIVHRIALSGEMKSELEQIDKDLDRSIEAEDPWTAIRQLTYRATQRMGNENTSWHGLVRRYRDEI